MKYFLKTKNEIKEIKKEDVRLVNLNIQMREMENINFEKEKNPHLSDFEKLKIKEKVREKIGKVCIENNLSDKDKIKLGLIDPDKTILEKDKPENIKLDKKEK